MVQSGGSEAVELPTDLTSQIRNRITNTDFDSVNDYVTYVMEEVLHHIEQNPQEFDQDDISNQEVEDRLRSLGYLNE